MQWLACVVLLVWASHCSAEFSKPEIASSKGQVHVTASDLQLHDPTNETDVISLRDLLEAFNALKTRVSLLESGKFEMSEIELAINKSVTAVEGRVQQSVSQLNMSMMTSIEDIEMSVSSLNSSVHADISDVKASVANNSQSILSAIDEAIEGLEDSQNSARESAINSVQDLVFNNTKKLRGIDELRSTVVDLSADVGYLVSHASNVTRCATDSSIHIGDGECAPAVKQCPMPTNPVNGKVVVSNPRYIVPGVTASYSCNSSDYFVLGGDSRVCSEKTYQFTPTVAPQCVRCEVTSCLKCAGVKDVCEVCAYGHDRTADGKACPVRKDTVYGLGWDQGYHKGDDAYYLPPGDLSWKSLAPKCTIKPARGAGALIRGTIYIVDRNCEMRSLPKGATAWRTEPSIPNLEGTSRCLNPYFANINGLSVASDGFYVFGRAGSARYQVDASGKGTWTR